MSCYLFNEKTVLHNLFLITFRVFPRDNGRRFRIRVDLMFFCNFGRTHADKYHWLLALRLFLSNYYLEYLRKNNSSSSPAKHREESVSVREFNTRTLDFLYARENVSLLERQLLRNT